jgi:tetratricopeptide (TPR) repeat protein
MARRKQRKTSTAQSSDALRHNGLQAFKRQDYSTAIAVWERAYKQRQDGQTAVALAEAHFRRGVSGLGSPEAALADLRRANELQPDDDCYAYHLALTLHRQGQPAAAIPLYQQSASEKAPSPNAPPIPWPWPSCSKGKTRRTIPSGRP